MSFGQPWLLATLLVIPLAVLAYVLLERRRARYAVEFTNLDVLASVAGGRSWWRLVAPAFLLLALASLCFAAARPRQRVLVPREKATVILVLDVSRSMEASDIKPTRLSAAEEAIRVFLGRVPKQVRVGLIIFAGDVDVVSPPTRDHALVRQSLDMVGRYSGYGGTAIGDALGAAVELAEQAVPEVRPTGHETIAYVAAPQPHSPVSILFLSDGHQTRGQLQPLEGAQRAKQDGIPVYTVALGTPGGHLDPRSFGFPPNGGPYPRSAFAVPPDPKTLHAIATLTGGKFFNATSHGILKDAYSTLGSHLGRKPGRQEVTWRFLLAAALLLLAAGVAGRVTAPPIP